MISAKNAVLLALAVGISVALGCLLLTALTFGDCESPPEPPVDTIQYPNEETTQASGGRTTSNYEKTTSNYEVQYPSELPDTSGVKLW